MLCVCAVSASENATEISVSDDVNQVTDADEEQIISADEDAQEHEVEIYDKFQSRYKSVINHLEDVRNLIGL